MPYFLRFDGTSAEEANLSSNTSRADATFRFEFKFSNRELTGVYNVINRIFKNTANLSSNIATNKAFDRDTVTIRTGGTTHGVFEYSSNPPLQDDNLPHVVQINYDGTTLSGSIDGNAFDNTITASGVTFSGFGSICEACLFDFYYFRYWSDNTGSTLVYDWNADSSQSDGSGSILYDDASGNNATLQNMEAGDWVFYSDPNPTISIDSAIAYSYTISDIQLAKQLILDIDTQSYSYSLDDISLTYQQLSSFNIDVDTQSYSYANSDIELSASRLISVVGQSYAYTLNDVNITLGKFLSVDSQDYAYTLNDIELTKISQLAIDVNTAAYQTTFNSIDVAYSGYVERFITESYKVNYKHEIIQAKYKNDITKINFKDVIVSAKFN